jgi:hypothetical protein
MSDVHGSEGEQSPAEPDAHPLNRPRSRQQSCYHNRDSRQFNGRIVNGDGARAVTASATLEQPAYDRYEAPRRKSVRAMVAGRTRCNNGATAWQTIGDAAQEAADGRSGEHQAESFQRHKRLRPRKTRKSVVHPSETCDQIAFRGAFDLLAAQAAARGVPHRRGAGINRSSCMQLDTVSERSLRRIVVLKSIPRQFIRNYRISPGQNSIL